jgi:hypothetical protein
MTGRAAPSSPSSAIHGSGISSHGTLRASSGPTGSTSPSFSEVAQEAGPREGSPCRVQGFGYAVAKPWLHGVLDVGKQRGELLALSFDLRWIGKPPFPAAREQRRSRPCRSQRRLRRRAEVGITAEPAEIGGCSPSRTGMCLREASRTRRRMLRRNGCGCRTWGRSSSLLAPLSSSRSCRQGFASRKSSPVPIAA